MTATHTLESVAHECLKKHCKIGLVPAPDSRLKNDSLDLLPARAGTAIGTSWIEPKDRPTLNLRRAGIEPDCKSIETLRMEAATFLAGKECEIELEIGTNINLFCVGAFYLDHLMRMALRAQLAITKLQCERPFVFGSPDETKVENEINTNIAMISASVKIVPTVFFPGFDCSGEITAQRSLLAQLLIPVESREYRLLSAYARMCGAQTMLTGEEAALQSYIAANEDRLLFWFWNKVAAKERRIAQMAQNFENCVAAFVTEFPEYA